MLIFGGRNGISGQSHSSVSMLAEGVIQSSLRPFGNGQFERKASGFVDGGIAKLEAFEVFPVGLAEPDIVHTTRWGRGKECLCLDERFAAHGEPGVAHSIALTVSSSDF